MKTIYKAISSNNITEFNNKCNEAMQHGFTPAGSICVTTETGVYGYTVYAQAFMYYERQTA